MTHLKHFLSVAVFSFFLLSARAAYADTLTGSSVSGQSFGAVSDAGPVLGGLIAQPIIAAGDPDLMPFTVESFSGRLPLAVDGSAFAAAGPMLTASGTRMEEPLAVGKVETAGLRTKDGSTTGVRWVRGRATPEFSGLMLLGTGMLGLSGAMRCGFKQ